MKILFKASCLFLVCVSIFMACGQQPQTQNQDAMDDIAYTSDYICPMHCEGSGSSEAGLCPSCGMDYVKNEKP